MKFEYPWSTHEPFGPVWLSASAANRTALALNMRKDALVARRREDARKRKAAQS